MALGIDGLRVGHWTSPQQRSGCTVILPPPGTLGAMAVRGGAPGTREAAALSATGKITECHAVVLSGGSAYGLATADGVMGWLESRGVGYRVGRGGLVPIVGAAIVLDTSVVEASERPDATAGAAACDAARSDEPAIGRVGAGAGCTVAKIGGLDFAWRGGIGTAVRTVTLESGPVTVAAIVANNALGEIIGGDGQKVAASRARALAPRYPLADRQELLAAVADHTVIGCVITDAPLDKPSAARVADLAHTGIARAVDPAHTTLDGDAIFCLATGTADLGAHDGQVDLIAALAAEVVAEATRAGPIAATGAHGLPGLADHR